MAPGRVKDHEAHSLAAGKGLAQRAVQSVDLPFKTRQAGVVIRPVDRVQGRQGVADGPGLNLHQGRGEPHVGVQDPLGARIVVMIVTGLPFVAMGRHRPLVDAGRGVHHPHPRVGRLDARQPGSFKRHPHREIRFGGGQGRHLARLGLVGGGTGAGGHHDRDRHMAAAHLLHEVLLGQDADKNRQGIAGGGRGRTAQEQECGQKTD